MSAKKYREILKEFPTVEEGKLVSDMAMVIKTILEKLEKSLRKEYEKNSERGIASINTVASMVGAKVTDKKQEKGKLFLKFGDDMNEMAYLHEEDVAVKAALLKASQISEMEALKRQQVEEMEAMKERHTRENDKLALQKEKDSANKAIAAERDAARKAAQNESLSANADLGDYIKDFKTSDAPQFKGKSDKKIRQMAMAAWQAANE